MWSDKSRNKRGSPTWKLLHPRVHPRYTIERHKRKIMARFLGGGKLSPTCRLWIRQYYSPSYNKFSFMIELHRTGKRTKKQVLHGGFNNCSVSCRFALALGYLIDEGKLDTTIENSIWKAQIACGLSTNRTIFLKY